MSLPVVGGVLGMPTWVKLPSSYEPKKTAALFVVEGRGLTGCMLPGR